MKISSVKASDHFLTKIRKVSLWKFFWGSFHKGLKLVYFNSYGFISVQEEFKFSIRKRWKCLFVKFSQYSCKVNHFSSQKGTFRPMSITRLLGKGSFMEGMSVWLQCSSKFWRLKRCSWKETKKLLWIFFYRQKLREKKRKKSIFPLV